VLTDLSLGDFVILLDYRSSPSSVFFFMDRSKIVAVVTGVISLVFAIAYLLIVQIIDFRGEMLPAPMIETILLGIGF
jgi:hypothetical protein